MLNHRNCNGRRPRISVNSVANVCGCDVLGLLIEEIVLNGGRAQQSTKRAKEIAERCSAGLGGIIFSIELVRRASSDHRPGLSSASASAATCASGHSPDGYTSRPFPRFSKDRYRGRGKKGPAYLATRIASTGALLEANSRLPSWASGAIRLRGNVEHPKCAADPLGVFQDRSSQ
jgi:hypothetical protein